MLFEPINPNAPTVPTMASKYPNSPYWSTSNMDAKNNQKIAEIAFEIMYDEPRKVKFLDFWKNYQC